MHRRDFLKTTAAGALAPIALTQQTQQQQPSSPKAQQFRERIKPISKDERLERQENARRLMAEHNLDAILMEGGTTLNYFAGINWWRSERLFAMILPKSGEPVFVAPKFEEGRALEQVGDARLLTWQEDESPYTLIKQILQEKSIATGTLGIEETVRYFVSNNVAQTVGSVKLVDATPVAAGCRSVKSAHEIELMQIANDITKEVYLAAVRSLKEEMTEREFGSIISKLFSEYGANGGALVLFGEASAYPHGTIKQHTLKQGDIVLIDGGCSVEGYNSDVTRTTVYGTPNEKQKEVWQIVRRAQDAALVAAKPGIPAEVIDAAARQVITDAGYGPDYIYFTHRLGHGIGMDGHEWYYLVRGSKRPVQAGNTFSDEPGIYIPGEFGIRLEDELLLTADGARLMLPQAKSLEEMF